VPGLAFYYDPIHVRHDVGPHPERPDRVEAVMARLRQSGSIDSFQHLQPRAATEEELELVHPAAHVQRIRQLAEQGGASIDPDTAVAPGSFDAATHAAGGALAGIDAVCRDGATRAFSLIRPPGHHATATRAMGFCLFNNIAVAAAYARLAHDVERIAIVDIDVHHGNGTQDIFWDDPNLLYLSMHQFPFYPGTGDWSETGGPDAVGATVNVPLQSGSGDAEYLRIFDRLFLPLMERFGPEIILVSAGYDAHVGDPLAGMEVSTAGYRAIMSRISACADAESHGRLLTLLEGGYDLSDLADSVQATLVALSEDSATFDSSPPAGSAFERYLDRLSEVHGLSG
jgi:acetoin utilization deacetylase AcuC-like enzyme